MNIHTNTLILENCVLLVFKRCFNLSFEKQLSSSTFLLLSGCWNRRSSFCLHKVQADVADVHRVNKTRTHGLTQVQCVLEALHNRVLRAVLASLHEMLTELNHICMQSSSTVFGINIFKSLKATMMLSLKKLSWLIQSNDRQDLRSGIVELPQNSAVSSKDKECKQEIGYLQPQ